MASASFPALRLSPHGAGSAAASSPKAPGQPAAPGTGARGAWRSPAVLVSVLFFSQDPTNLDKFNVSNFFHVKNNMRIIDPGMDAEGEAAVGGVQALGQALPMGPDTVAPEWL